MTEQHHDRQTMERLHQHLARADLELRDAQHVLAPDSDEEAEMDIAHAVSAARLGVTTALEMVRTQLGEPEPPESPTEAAEQPGRVGPQTPLEGAQEPQESPGLAEDEQQGRGPVPDAGESQEPSERPWWRRIFEG
jgi:hypothetical protein